MDAALLGHLQQQAADLHTSLAALTLQRETSSSLLAGVQGAAARAASELLQEEALARAASSRLSSTKV